MLGEDHRRRGGGTVCANENVLRVIDEPDARLCEISRVGEFVDGDNPHTFADKCARTEAER